ncbi:MAG: hypothetical protein WB679_03985 [Terracidiphilus sp.]
MKGNLFLTGDEWSSERRYDDRGHLSGYQWYYDFNEGRADNEPSGFPYSSSLKRALWRANGRFLQGHSSGGWATLQLQVNYPRIFGGTWSTSPDPSDFHDFTGVDLYADHANVYKRSDGTSYPLVRDHACPRPSRLRLDAVE